MSAPVAHHHSRLWGARLEHRRPLVDRADPRVRVVWAVAFALLVAVMQRPVALASALGAALAAAWLAGLPWGRLWRRMLPVNLFVLLLAILVPLSAGETPFAQWGPLTWTSEGFNLALVIALKTNAIVLGLIVLVGSLDVGTLGHALLHLHLPEKLIHLLLFTVRYIDVLEREGQRLRAAMRLRAFRPGVNWHSFRAYGHLLGMLLVRSLDRSERIVAAMKCRGFRGRFYLLDHFHSTGYDWGFSLGAAVVAVFCSLAEWG